MFTGARALMILICAARLWAQVPSIEGTVVDSATGIPIAGAMVALERSASQLPVSNTQTGASGTFRLKPRSPGNYAVEASAPGYLNAVYGQGRETIPVAARDLDPGAVNQPHIVVLKLVRSVAVTGHIRDGETEKPLKFITVRALRASWNRGARRLSEEKLAFSDEKGDFRLESLTPGDYILEIQNRNPENSKPGKRYPQMIWPPQSTGSLQPLTVPPGAEFDAGTIGYVRTGLPKVRGPLKAECPGGSGYAMYAISVTQRVGGVSLRTEVPGARSGNSPAGRCEDPFLLTLPSAGAWRIQSRVWAGTRMLLFGSTELNLAEESDTNVELRPVDLPSVSGRVVCECAEDSKIALEAIGIQIASLDEPALAVSTVTEHDGTIQPAVIPAAGPATVTIRKLPDGVVVKRVLFNGADPSLTLIPGSGASMEITLADRPATITGTAAAPYVAIAPWPLVLRHGYPDFTGVATEKDGRFMIPNLPPDDYRIVTLTAAQWARKDEPDLMAGWLREGEKITLAPNQTRTIAVALP